MQAVIYTGSYWENFRNIENGSRKPYERESRRDGKNLWCKIDNFQLVLQEDGIPVSLFSKCLPHKWPELEDYRTIGEELGVIAAQRGITDYKGIKDGKRFNKDNFEIEDISVLHPVDLAQFEWGFLLRIPKLVRARSRIHLIGTS